MNAQVGQIRIDPFENTHVVTHMPVYYQVKSEAIERCPGLCRNRKWYCHIEDSSPLNATLISEKEVSIMPHL